MSTPSFSIVHLQCFVFVVDSGSFAEAGRRLGLSTSGVSKTIARLEALKGVRLLNRSTHSLSLTPEGETLIGPAREAVRSVEVADHAFAEAAGRGAVGRVRVGAPTAFLRTCIAPMLPAFRKTHPDIVLDLRGSDEMVDLAEGGLDIVLRAGRVEGVPGHLRQPLLIYPWVTCASPAYLARRPALSSPGDLAEHDLIGFRNQRTGLLYPWRFRGDRADGGARRHPSDPAVVMDDANAVVAGAVAGAGVAWAPHWLVADPLRSGALEAILEDWACEPTTISILRRKAGHDADRVARVIAFLRANLRDFAGW